MRLEPKHKQKQSLGVVEPGAEELLEYRLKVPQLPPSVYDPYNVSIEYTLRFMVSVIYQRDE